jgi:hypothetical protein
MPFEHEIVAPEMGILVPSLHTLPLIPSLKIQKSCDPLEDISLDIG